MLQDCFPDFQILQATSEPCLNGLKCDSKDFDRSTYIGRPIKASLKCSQLLKHNRHQNSKVLLNSNKTIQEPLSLRHVEDAYQKSDTEKTSGSESGIFCSAETLNNENDTDLKDNCRLTTERKLLNSNRGNDCNATTATSNIDNLSLYLNKPKKIKESLEAIKIITDERQAFQIKNQDKRQFQNVLTDYRYVPDISSKQNEMNGMARQGFAQGIEDHKYLKGRTYDSQNKVQRQKRIITRSKQTRRLTECRDINFRFTKRSRSKVSTVQNRNVKNRQENIPLQSAQQNKMTTLRQLESVKKSPGKDLGYPHVMDDRQENIKDNNKKDNEKFCTNVAFSKNPGLCLSKYLNLKPESKEYQHHHLNDEQKNMEDEKNIDKDDTRNKLPLSELSNSYLSNYSNMDPKRTKDLSGFCQGFSMNQQHLVDHQGMSTNEIPKHLKNEYQEKQITLYRHYFHLLEKLNISKKEAELAADLQIIEKLCTNGTNHHEDISRSCSNHQKRSCSHDHAYPKPTDDRIDRKGSEFDSFKSLFDSNHQKPKGLSPPNSISNRTSDAGPGLSCSNFPLYSNHTKQSYLYDNGYHKSFCDRKDSQYISRCKCSYQESSQDQPFLNGLHTKLHTKPTLTNKSHKECSDHSCRCEETLLPSLLQFKFQETQNEPKYQKHKTTKYSSGNIANNNNKDTSVLLQNSSGNHWDKKCQNSIEKSHTKDNDPTERSFKPNLFSVRNPNDFMTAKEAANVLKSVKIKSEYSSQQQHYFILEVPSEKKTASLREQDSFMKYAGRDLKYPHLEINKDILDKGNNKHTSEDIELYETINNEPEYKAMSKLKLNTNVRSGNLKTFQKNQNLLTKIFRKTKNTLTLHSSTV